MKGPKNSIEAFPIPFWDPQVPVEPPSPFDSYRSLLSVPQEPQDSYMKEMANSETMFERYDRQAELSKHYGGPDHFGEEMFRRHTSEGGSTFPRNSILENKRR